MCCVSGMGRDKTRQTVDSLLESGSPALLIGTGFCGALDPRLNPGDIVLATEVVQAGEERKVISCAFPEMEELSRRIEQDVRVFSGKLVSTNRVAALPKEKRDLNTRHNAVAVDMESAALAETCADRDIPWIVIRVVSDTCADSLPPSVQLIGEGSVLSGAIQLVLDAAFSSKARQSLIRLRRNTQTASQSLAKALHATLEFLKDRTDY